MSLKAEEALAISMDYTKKTVEGAGDLKGKNCTIQSITKVDGGNNVVFAWELDDGTTETGTMFVADGEKGEKGDTGATPQFSVGDVITVDSNIPASVTITGTVKNPILNMNIPKGEPAELPDIDTSPKQNSTNLVASGGVYNALNGKQDVLTFDIEPVQNSTNPVTSGGVYTGLDNKFGKVRDLTSTDNLNDIVISGIYDRVVALEDAIAQNYPERAMGTLEVFAYERWQMVFQRYTSMITGYVYIRKRQTIFTTPEQLKWSSWKRVLDDSMMDSIPTQNSTKLVTSGGIYNTTLRNLPAKREPYNTGRVWLDGSPIYRIDFSTAVPTSSLNIDSINNTAVIKFSKITNFDMLDNNGLVIDLKIIQQYGNHNDNGGISVTGIPDVKMISDFDFGDIYINTKSINSYDYVILCGYLEYVPGNFIASPDGITILT